MLVLLALFWNKSINWIQIVKIQNIRNIQLLLARTKADILKDKYIEKGHSSMLRKNKVTASRKHSPRHLQGPFS